MDAEQLIKAGDVQGALDALQDQVRKNPQVAKLRIFLFQLLCVKGDWKRAVTQLKVCGELDPAAVTMAQTYREAIICEIFRGKVFAGEKEPLVFGEPQEWVALLIEALKTLARGEPEKAAELRARAFEDAPAAAGTLNGTKFEWVADADMRLGPVLEVIVNGRYFWAPFNAIHRIVAEEPVDLRDRVWTPAQVTWASGGETVAFIPTRYPGAEDLEDDALKLSRGTEWRDVGAETYVGDGQRLLATPEGDTALMDLRELVIGDPPAVAAGDEAEGGAAPEEEDV